MFSVARNAGLLGARAVARSQLRGFRSSAPLKQAAEPFPQRLISGVRNRIVDPVIYYTRVFLEVVRTSSSHQGISPLALPGQLGEAREGFVGFFRALQNGNWRNVTLGQVRNLAARGLEVLGFFAVGEMIGRRNIIGYKVEGARTHAGHH